MGCLASRRARRAFTRRLALALGVLCGAFALAAPPALAVTQFGIEGEGAGQFNSPSGIAFNQEGTNLYIADELNNRVEEFGADGAFVRAWGFGVSDGESEEFQICEAPGPCFAGIPGSAGGQFAIPSGVAVDNSAGLAHGSVYVEDPPHHRIERFGEDGELILTFGGEVNATSGEDVCLAGEACQAGTPGPGPSQFQALEHNAIAVGPTGTVYVGDLERVQKFSSGGVPEGEIALPGAGVVQQLAVDSSGALYVLSSAREGIRQYDGSGTEVGSPRDPGASGFHVAITLGASDELFVSDPENRHIFEYDAGGAQSASFAEEGNAQGGIALNDATNALYVLHAGPARVVVFPVPPSGPYILEGSQGTSEIKPTCATLKAQINPEGASPSKYRFEYGTTEAYGQATAQTPLEGGEFEDQAASATVCGLQPSTLYHFRAVAENELGQSAEGPDQTFTTLPPVSIDAEWSANVTATSAKLFATLNPHGLPSEYHFEYGLSASYEKSAPAPDAQTGEGEEDATFSVAIQELKPATTYHYRVIAHNSLGVSAGPDQTFTTQQQEAPSLPDGRAYEMVSPPEKHGVSLEGLTAEGGAIQAAADGGGLAYVANGPIVEDPAGNHSIDVSQLLGRRTAPGVWSAQDITTPHQAPAGVVPGFPAEYRLFSSDLARGAVEPEGATPLSAQASERTPYRREANGAYTPLVYPGNVPAGTKFGGEETAPEQFPQGGVIFVTGTPDLGHVLLTSPAALVQGYDSAEQVSIYEWSEGTLAAVSLIPPAGANDCGGVGAPCVPASQEGLANVGNSSNQVRGAISDDGGRAFFATSAHQHLYVRDMGLGQTLRVDAPAPGVKESEGGAVFQLANGDGSKAFFTSIRKLTKDATARPQEPDLYECEIAVHAGKLTCALKDLSVDPHPGESAEVQGVVLGAGEDGRYVYFVARGALEEGAASGGSCPGAGEGQCVNLYAYDTVAQSRRLVAVLSSEDFPDWRAGGQGEDLGEVTTRVSPDGQQLAFMSERSLTGFDNHDAKSGALDEEVYLYDYAHNELRCASCGVSGQRPAGVADEEQPGPLVDRPRVWRGHWLAGSIPGWTHVGLAAALHDPRYLSDSGRLFFNSAVGLVPADGNGTQDVYQFEPGGVGGCALASGCVSLVSSGTSSEESAFLDASESGDDVFFLTAAQLSLVDVDRAFDVYDAHVCSSAQPCAQPPVGAPPPCGSSDACRAAPAAQPDVFGSPASETFSGAGNLAPPAAVTAKPLTRAQRLAKALKACKRKPKRKRAACRRQAQRRYGAHRAAHKTTNKGGRS
jgi:DNA-binding beta-propeller fold protein YncE